MKIVSDCFNFVTTMLSYHIKFINVLDTVYFIYVYPTVAAPRFWFGGRRTLDKISYMNSSQVLYCNGVAKISVLKRHSARIYSSKTFEKNFEKFIKQFAQKFKKFSKFFKTKI